MLDLYTLICEYDGGNYIAQVNASSPKNAILSRLGDRYSPKCIPKAARLRIKEELDDDPPVAIDSCRNVWCCSASSNRGLVLINLVRTSSSRRKPSYTCVVAFSGASTAQNFSIPPYFSVEINSLPAGLAHDALAFVSGELFRRQFDFHPLRREQIIVGDFAVGQHLLLVLVSDFGMHLARQCL